MAAPTPTTTTNWDGFKGKVRWRAAWGAGDSNFTDTTLVDVSGLSPTPGDNAIKITRIDTVINGDVNVKFEWNEVAQGTVDTTTANTRATWATGDQFVTTWLTNPGNDEITINGTVYTITTVDSVTQITLASDPGDQTGVAYSVDEILERFIGQSDVTYHFLRDYSDGPNGGLIPTKSSSIRTGATGDLILTTTNAASADEISLTISFERDR